MRVLNSSAKGTNICTYILIRLRLKNIHNSSLDQINAG